MDFQELIRIVKADSDRLLHAAQNFPDDAPAWQAIYVQNLVNPLHSSVAAIVEYLAAREGHVLDDSETDALILPFKRD